MLLINVLVSSFCFTAIYKIVILSVQGSTADVTMSSCGILCFFPNFITRKIIIHDTDSTSLLVICDNNEALTQKISFNI